MSKAASRADLNPELEILIDTKAYNGIKVIMRMVHGVLVRFKSSAEVSLCVKSSLFSMEYRLFLNELFGIYVCPASKPLILNMVLGLALRRPM
jgi:hypothetical protein